MELIDHPYLKEPCHDHQRFTGTIESRSPRISARSMPAIVAALAGAVAVGLLWAATAWGTAPAPVDHKTTVIRPDKGDLEIKYMVQDTASTASGSTVGGVTAIEFHTNYIVVRYRDGSGRVFFNERTRELSWSPAAPNKG
jgi:hypothetical protein